MDAYSYENDPTAVVGRRVAAFLIDLLSAVVVGAVVLALTGLTKVITDDAGFAIEGPQGNISDFDPSQIILEVGNDVFVVDSMRNFWIGAAVFLLFLWIFVQALTGRTLGKWVTGVRTIAADGGNPGILRTIGRTLMWVIDVFLIGPMLALSTAGHRRLGDLLGRTFVVDQEFAGTGITIEDGSARTRTVGDDEIDLREEREPAPSRKDKKQAERDAEERLRIKAEEDAKAKADTKVDRDAGRPTPVEKAKPVIKTPEPVVAEPAPERVAVPAAAAYGAGAAAAASATGPAWPDLADARPQQVTTAAPQVADATPASPGIGSATPMTAPSPIATPATVTSPSPTIATPTPTTPSTAFPPTAFGGGPSASDSTSSATTPSTPDPTVRERDTAEPAPSDPTPTPAATEQPATQNASGEWEYEPQWDDARQTYILWDARRSEWLEWSDGTGTWGPISQ